MALFAVLMCVNFAACGDDELPIRTEENSKVGKLIFALEGMPASSGDTIHIIDRLEECSLSWKREDGTVTNYDYATQFYFDEGPAYWTSSDGMYANYIKIAWDSPGFCKIRVQDPFLYDVCYQLYIDIQEMDLKKQLKIQYFDSWKDIDGTIHKGPFVALYTDKNVGSSRLEVLSFGCENHTYESNAYWRKNIDCDLYYGKMTVSYIIGEPSYYFFIFKYGDKIHEIRRYTDGRGYLWDGEWNQ